MCGQYVSEMTDDDLLGHIASLERTLTEKVEWLNSHTISDGRTFYDCYLAKLDYAMDVLDRRTMPRRGLVLQIPTEHGYRTVRMVEPTMAARVEE